MVKLGALLEEIDVSTEYNVNRSRDLRVTTGQEVELSIILPAWNEAPRIGRTLDQIFIDLPKRNVEILVVDDGSTDTTVEVVKSWQLKHPNRKVRLIEKPHTGKGGTIVAGIHESTGIFVGLLDADLDIKPSQLWKVFEIAGREELDIVVGAKQELPWEQRGANPLRRLLSSSFSAMNYIFLRLPVKDTQTGCKVFRGEWIRSVVSLVKAQGYLFDVEILGMASHDRLQMKEVAVAIERSDKPNRIGLKSVLGAAVEWCRVVYYVKSYSSHFKKKKTVIDAGEIGVSTHASIDA
ncbi:glycosyltransferase [Paenibacillus aurantiacus]|uniref:Glycosyltransferase n=1 Tax=Paenibacillus aurantiacus TaxID=1936118 RepID=A0ABV5KNY9_9BACL